MKSYSKEKNSIAEEYDSSPDRFTCMSFLIPCCKKNPKKQQRDSGTALASREKIQSIQNYNSCNYNNIYPSSIKPASQDLQKSKQYNEMSYPKNKLFLLKSKYPKCVIITKCTEKKFQLDVAQQDVKEIRIAQNNEHMLDNEMQKYFEKGIKCTCSESWKEITPEKIGKYIARRVRHQSLVIDLGCGIGSNTIQFATECDFVIGIEINQSKILDAKYNCQQLKLSDKVEFILANLLVLNQLKADVVFINPTVKEYEKIDLFRDCVPNIYKLMQRALHIAPNVILQLPKNIDLQQIPAIFDLSRYEFLKNNHPFDYAIEIESIYVNNQIEYYIIYFGEIANISEQEIFQFYSRQLLVSGSEVDGINIKEKLGWILRTVKNQIGSYRLFQMVNELRKCSQRDFDLNSKNQKPIIEQFIEELYYQKIINKQELLEISAFPTRSLSVDAGLLQTMQLSLENEGIIRQKQQQTVIVQTEQERDGPSPYIEQIFNPEDFSYKSYTGNLSIISDLIDEDGMSNYFDFKKSTLDIQSKE